MLILMDFFKKQVKYNKIKIRIEYFVCPTRENLVVQEQKQEQNRNKCFPEEKKITSWI